MIEMQTPFVVKVAILKSEYARLSESVACAKPAGDLPPIDAAVLDFLYGHGQKMESQGYQP